MGKKAHAAVKKPIGKRIGKFFLIFFAVILILSGIIAAVNAIGVYANLNFVKSIKPIEYGAQLEPTLDQSDRYTFVTDRDFKVVQLTDVHLGGGFMSIKKDSMAINAVAAMLTAEKPDLVVVSGDIAFPVPFQAGTFNNKSGAKLFAELMEQLGVYWAPVFGNHDTEIYSYFSREDIGELYESGAYPHCLFQSGPNEVDGVGNYCVNVKNSDGLITQSLILFDSHSYLDEDAFGILWKYDCIHTNQIEWYEQTVRELTEQNGGSQPKSLAFFHIPPKEMRDAYTAYYDNGFQDTETIQYVYGKIGEKESGIFTSALNNGLVDKMIDIGSTQGIFFGHDHLNTLALDYKGIQLTYGYSVDYLAYMGIMKYGLQRGCTVITVAPDGSFTSTPENYYQDKYQPAKAKERVSMVDMYPVT